MYFLIWMRGGCSNIDGIWQGSFAMLDEVTLQKEQSYCGHRICCHTAGELYCGTDVHDCTLARARCSDRYYGRISLILAIGILAVPIAERILRVLARF